MLDEYIITSCLGQNNIHSQMKKTTNMNMMSE